MRDGSVDKLAHVEFLIPFWMAMSRPCQESRIDVTMCNDQHSPRRRRPDIDSKGELSESPVSESPIPKQWVLVACSLTFELLRLFFNPNAQPLWVLFQAFGKTVFFLPHETSANEMASGLKGSPSPFLDWYIPGWESDVSESRSHHRVLEYDFGGLKCVMRFQADGYVTGFAAWSEQVHSDHGGSH